MAPRFSGSRKSGLPLEGLDLKFRVEGLLGLCGNDGKENGNYYHILG